MKKKVLVFGAGSIGAHHINAALSLKSLVKFTDINFSQVIYLKNELYPSRYKKWNNLIEFVPYENVFNLTEKFDLIVLGVPPEFHLSLLKSCISKLNFKKILVEKPFNVYNQNLNFVKKSKFKKKIFCGFNHSLSKSFIKLQSILKKNLIGEIYKIKINWKEDFNYVLKAHPWIKNIKESYLSNLKRGGGGLQEYSHAIHLAVLLKKILFKKDSFLIKKKIECFKKNKIFYDFKSEILFKKGKKEMLIEIDTISKKVKKDILILGSKGKIIWERNLDKKRETIKIVKKRKTLLNFKIDRAQDFIAEHKILLDNSEKNVARNINIDISVETMILINRLLKNV